MKPEESWDQAVISSLFASCTSRSNAASDHKDDKLAMTTTMMMTIKENVDYYSDDHGDNGDVAHTRLATSVHFQ